MKSFSPLGVCGLLFATSLLVPPAANLSAQTAPAAPKSLGDQIVADYWKKSETDPKPQKIDCTAIALKRVRAALVKYCGAEPGVMAENQFKLLWNSNFPDKNWAKLPENLRGLGPAGAMKYAKLGTLVSQEDIWAGKLLPGAVIQVWKQKESYEQVKKGQMPTGIGHSFIFLEYVRDGGGKIIGMKIADQGTRWSEPATLGQEAFAVWFAANVNCAE